MADTKISDLAALTSLATGDLSVWVDVSDTTMAASGTDKKVTLADVAAAILASPALTGTPTAPTATGGTNTTQVATTAFVTAAVGGGAGGGGGVTVGGAITSGTNHLVLYQDASGNLAQNGNLNFNATASPKTLTIGGSGSHPANLVDVAITHSNSGGLTLTNGDLTVSGSLRTIAGGSIYFPAAGGITVAKIVSSSTSAELAAGAGGWQFGAAAWGASNGSATNDTAQDAVRAWPASTRLANYRSFAAYNVNTSTVPSWWIDSGQDMRFARTTTVQDRPSGAIKSALIVATDASYTARTSVMVSDAAGEREGLSVQSTGAIANVVVPIANVRDAADDSAAASLSPAVPVGGIYRTGSQLKIRTA